MGRPALLAFPEQNLVQAMGKPAGALHLVGLWMPVLRHGALGWITEMELWLISSSPG